MAASCGNKCVKSIFWLLNFLFFILGAVILGLSLWIRFDQSTVSKLAQSVNIDLNIVPMDTYFACVLVLLIIEIVAIVLYFVNKTNLRDMFYSVWKTELIGKYSSYQPIKDAVDKIQTGLHCCGATGCTDWTLTGSLPPSSCTSCSPSMTGCAELIWNVLEENLVYVIIALAIILIIEVFALIFGCIVISGIKEKRASE
ncbi:hypothetical protein WR25_21684 [Diploscapter pachys]|uniref:Tetraspanin n=1 Tax=Diploscapter pachys TaxID=2018661 RepID=A0A2A2LBW4_9BILA|nr:hypothetical protein WR25_21684 [Diploscapter pachys]